MCKKDQRERAAEDRVGGMDQGEEGLRGAGHAAGGGAKKMKITHLEQSLLNYSTHILPPLGYVGVELVQIGGER